MKNQIFKLFAIVLLATVAAPLMASVSLEFGLTRVVPGSATVGQTLPVSFYGMGFDESTGIGFMPTDGILFNSVKFVSPSHMQADIAIAAEAVPGIRDALVSSRDGKTAVLARCFTVIAREQPRPEPAKILKVTGFSPEKASQGQAIQARITGTGFDEDTHICFCHSFDAQPAPLMQLKKCGDTKHKQFIETFSKEKDATGCHTIVITKKCYVGTCVLEAHGSDKKHNYSWVPCKDQSHASKPVTEKFCTTDEAKSRRNARYNSLVDLQNEEGKERSGISVEHLSNSGETALACTLVISAEAIAETYDLAAMSSDGARFVLKNALRILKSEPQPELMPESIETGDGFFRIRGASLEPLAGAGWLPLPTTPEGKPALKSWLPPPAMEDVTICYASEKLMVAGNGKVLVLKWSEFLPKTKNTDGLKADCFYRQENGDLEILCLLKLSAGSDNPAWSYCLTHVTMP
jgi:hypothetical protein